MNPPQTPPDHCHWSYHTHSGYRSRDWWPTPDEAASAAKIFHPEDQNFELIADHAENCHCPPQTADHQTEGHHDHH